MQTLWTIKEALPEEVEVEQFRTDDSLGLTSLTLTAEEKMTQELINGSITVLQENLDSFSLRGRLNNDQLQVSIG